MHHPNCEFFTHPHYNSELIIPPSPCPQKHFYLSKRGVYQYSRNNSGQIWKIFGQSPSGYCLCCYDGHSTANTTINYQIGNADHVYNKQLIPKSQQAKYDQNKVLNDLDKSVEKNPKKKNINFNQINMQNNANKNKQYIEQKKNVKPNKINENIIQDNLTEQQKRQRQKYLRECFYIHNYLKGNKANTRELANTAIKLLYQKPCLQSYGRANTKGTNNGFIYNNFMKTHNIQPHIMNNQPKKYQTYQNSLNFCKRAKLNPQDRWKRIHRQMAKKLSLNKLNIEDVTATIIDINDKNLLQTPKPNASNQNTIKIKRSKSLQNLHNITQILGFNQISKFSKNDTTTTKATTNNIPSPSADKINSYKKSKSFGQKQFMFIYRYTDPDGNTQYCKDRHGLTCYVDPTFNQNKQACTKFLKSINPIEGEDVHPSDRNLEKIKMKNFIQAKEEDLPRHYLMPNCDEPYRPQKYSIKYKKRNNSVQPLAK